MGSLTTLYGGSSGGGGGSDSHIITDPKKLVRSAAGRFNIKTTTSISFTSASTTFFTQLLKSTHGATVATTASDTYVTLLDITSSNGGYLHWILSNCIRSSTQTCTVKITVDGGTPVEITYQHPTLPTGEVRMFLGGGISTARFSTSTSNTSLLFSTNYWNSLDAYGFTNEITNTPTNYDDSTNNVYGIGQYEGYIQSDFAILTNMPYQKLEFTSDLKIEVKQSTYVTTAASNYAGCFYTLF